MGVGGEAPTHETEGPKTIAGGKLAPGPDAAKRPAKVGVTCGNHDQ
jgi:hypothetical protein